MPGYHGGDVLGNSASSLHEDQHEIALPEHGPCLVDGIVTVAGAPQTTRRVYIRRGFPRAAPRWCPVGLKFSDDFYQQRCFRHHNQLRGCLSLSRPHIAVGEDAAAHDPIRWNLEDVGAHRTTFCLLPSFFLGV